LDEKPRLMEAIPWEIEPIPDTTAVYRMVPSHMVKKGSRIPSESMFMPDADGLSVDWDKYATPEESLIRVGLTFRFNTQEFKDPTCFLVFKLKVGQTRQMEGVSQILHSPVFHAEPPLIGQPNNRSHSSIFGTDEEVRLKLRDAATEVAVDMEVIEEAVRVQRG
jgi:hypothetical protein